MVLIGGIELPMVVYIVVLLCSRKGEPRPDLTHHLAWKPVAPILNTNACDGESAYAGTQ